MRSVDRSEFEALERRVGGVKGDVREVCTHVADVARQVAVSDARLVGLGDLMKAQGDALSHQMPICGWRSKVASAPAVTDARRPAIVSGY